MSNTSTVAVQLELPRDTSSVFDFSFKDIMAQLLYRYSGQFFVSVGLTRNMVLERADPSAVADSEQNSSLTLVMENDAHSWVSRTSMLSYNGVRGAISVTKRHAVTQVRGYTRTIERPKRYAFSITEDLSKYLHSDRVIDQVRGRTRSIERKLRWSSE